MFDLTLGALESLLSTYNMILKVDLSKDSYEIIKFKSDGLFKIDCYTSLTEWLFYLADTGMIYKEDIDYYKYNLRLSYVRDYFDDINNINLMLKYRINQPDGFHWTSLEIVRANDFTAEKPTCYVFSKDINNSYIHENESLRQLEHYCNFDSLTGLLNFRNYKDYCLKYKFQNEKHDIGVIFSDVNGLKIINDTQGHDEGNNLLCSYSILLNNLYKNELVYRISGDEFLIIFYDISKEKMKEEFSKLNQRLHKSSAPIASIGYAWENAPDTIENVVKVAEANMYIEKQSFYKIHPEYNRTYVSESYANEVHLVINSLSEAYPTLGIVNAKEDSYKILKMDPSIGNPMMYPSFTDYQQAFIHDHVAKSSYERVECLSSLQSLLQTLDHKDELIIRFETVQHTWRVITYRVLERSNGSIIKLIFFAKQISE